MNDVKNLFADVPAKLKDELIETVLQTSAFRIERIVSRGHCSPDGFWYDQHENEWVILLQGNAGLRFDDQKDVVTLKQGDSLHIDRHRKHRVEWTDPCQETVWLAVYYSGAEGEISS
jgi:cupin 2 domain-containing protein